jgi:hypothetical protein
MLTTTDLFRESFGVPCQQQLRTAMRALAQASSRRFQTAWLLIRFARAIWDCSLAKISVRHGSAAVVA